MPSHQARLVLVTDVFIMGRGEGGFHRATVLIKPECRTGSIVIMKPPSVSPPPPPPPQLAIPHSTPPVYLRNAAHSQSHTVGIVIPRHNITRLSQDPRYTTPAHRSHRARGYTCRQINSHARARGSVYALTHIRKLCLLLTTTEAVGL